MRLNAEKEWMSFVWLLGDWLLFVFELGKRCWDMDFFFAPRNAQLKRHLIQQRHSCSEETVTELIF